MGLTQADVADACGMAVSVLSSLERGKSQLTPRRAKQLEPILGVSLEFYITYNDKNGGFCHA